MIVRLALAFLGAASALQAAGAQDFDPAAVDLAAMVRCEVPAQAYNGFAMWMAGDPSGVDTLGWTEAPSGNPFLREFTLPEPIDVFGHRTSTVVFGATGPLAVLDGVDPAALAQSLGIVPAMSSAEKFLGERVVMAQSVTDNGITFDTRVTLNVSTVESHPGKTLAGCSYRVDVR